MNYSIGRHSTSDLLSAGGETLSGVNMVRPRLSASMQQLNVYAHVQNRALDIAMPRATQSSGSATLGMLDGTIVARLQCHEEMGRVSIGRGGTAAVRIEDAYVHGVHCEIYWDPTARAHIIKHAGGRNGTFVNLQRLCRPARLIDGARVRIGKTELIYRRDS